MLSFIIKKKSLIFTIMFLSFFDLYAQKKTTPLEGLYFNLGGMGRAPDFGGSNVVGYADSYKTMAGIGGNLGLTYYSKVGLNLSYSTTLRYDFIHYSNPYMGDETENYEFISEHSAALTQSFRRDKAFRGYYGVAWSLLNLNKGYYFDINHPTIPAFYHKLQTYTVDIVGGMLWNNLGVEPRIMIGPKKNPFDSTRYPVYGMIRIYYQFLLYNFN